MRVNSTWVGGLSVSVTLCRSDMGHRRFFFTDEAFSLQTLKNAQMSTAMPRWTDDEPGQGRSCAIKALAWRITGKTNRLGLSWTRPSLIAITSFSSGATATRERSAARASLAH